MDPNTVRERLKGMGPWHHNVELAPGLWSNPAMGDHPMRRWQLIESHLPADLTGKTVLDLGCSSAYFAAMMKKRGAARVVAVDLVDSALAEARLLCEAWNLDVELWQGEIPAFLDQNRERFDYVIYLGVFNHFRGPVAVVDRFAAITKERLFFMALSRNEGRAYYRARLALFALYELGLLVKRGRGIDAAVGKAWRTFTEPLVVPRDLDFDDTYLLSHPGFPVVYFLEHALKGDPTTWWVATTPFLQAALRTGGFRAVRAISQDTFVCDVKA